MWDSSMKIGRLAGCVGICWGGGVELVEDSEGGSTTTGSPPGFSPGEARLLFELRDDGLGIWLDAATSLSMRGCSGAPAGPRRDTYRLSRNGSMADPSA